MSFVLSLRIFLSEFMRLNTFIIKHDSLTAQDEDFVANTLLVPVIQHGFVLEVGDFLFDVMSVPIFIFLFNR